MFLSPGPGDLNIYRREAKEGETAREYFRRVEIRQVKAALADLEALAAEAARPA